jgi:hypothetical protein
VLSPGNVRLVKSAAVAVASIAAAIGLIKANRRRRAGSPAIKPSPESPFPSSQAEGNTPEADLAEPIAQEEVVAECLAQQPVAPILGRFTHIYHMTHIDNLDSILKYGLKAKSGLESQGTRFVDISDPGVQSRRSGLVDPRYNRSIHEYVPFYLAPKNPMLSRRRDAQADIVILAISLNALASSQHLYTDGNAASQGTLFSSDANVLAESLEILLARFWTNFPDGRRRRCAEVLVYSHVDPRYIESVFCYCDDTLSEIRLLTTAIDSAVRSDFYF